MPPVPTSLQSKCRSCNFVYAGRPQREYSSDIGGVRWAVRHRKNVKSKCGEKTIGMGKAQQDPCIEINSFQMLLQVRKNDHNSFLLY